MKNVSSDTCMPKIMMTEPEVNTNKLARQALVVLDKWEGSLSIIFIPL